jgi:hypothetical protein
MAGQRRQKVRALNDPSATLAVHCGNGLDAGKPLSKYSFEPIQCWVS